MYPKGYLVFTITVLGMFGVRFPPSNVIFILFLFCIWVVWSLYQSVEKKYKEIFFSSNEWLVFLFFFSGFSALIYQVVWQRMLFTFFGVNIESVTMIVIIFMFGLGVGALIGGLVSKIFLNHLPKIFLFVEICIGFFGVFSGMLIDWIGVETTNYSQLEMVLTVYAFLAFPTLCMGMTLPILVEYLERNMKNVGKSVGTLYSINTLGSAVACIITAEIFFVFFGQTISLWIAAFFNLLIGYLVYLFTQSHLNSTA
jgi:predicted membrane-bound spermidine synthase